MSSHKRRAARQVRRHHDECAASSINRQQSARHLAGRRTVRDDLPTSMGSRSARQRDSQDASGTRRAHHLRRSNNPTKSPPDTSWKEDVSENHRGPEPQNRPGHFGSPRPAQWGSRASRI